MSDRITLYKDDSGEFRWTRTAANHEVVGASTESYVSKEGAEANIVSTQGGDFTIMDITEETE